MKVGEPVSFTWLRPTAQGGPLRTREQVAAEVHAVSLARGLDILATVLTCMAIDVEAGADDDEGNPQWWCPGNPGAWPDSMRFPHDSTSDDNRSSGYLQQQPGPNGEPWWGTTENMMTLAQAANTFQDRLTDDYHNAANDPHLAGQYIQAVQGSGFPHRYQEHWNTAWDVVNRALANPPAPVDHPPAVPPVPSATGAPRPDFNEYAVWSPNSESRGGTTIDLWLIHTEEGHDNADQLAHGMPNVSYHYTASEDPNDHGVTVVDVVDTDQASWSVGDANDRSINFCFAGSSVNDSRDVWMGRSHVIDVAAYLCVQDCLKYNFDSLVIPPPYKYSPPGVSDHRYVTEYIGWGTHTDVGDNFPWDYFTERIIFWHNALTQQGGTPVAGSTADQGFNNLIANGTDREVLNYIAMQIGPGDEDWPSKDMTLRDKVWSLTKRAAGKAKSGA